jgi:hypothetical protein
LVDLIYELLDAHDDRVQLAAHPDADIQWHAHVDYLRTLHRRGREVMALTCAEDARLE